MVNYRLCETLGSNSGVLEDSGLWDVMPCGRVGVFRRASICKWWGVQEEHESTTFLRNVGKHQPIDVVSHRRRPESYNRDYSYCGCNRDAIRPCFMGCKEHISSVHACYISDLSHPSWFNRLNEIFRSKEDGHDTTRNTRARPYANTVSHTWLWSNLWHLCWEGDHVLYAVRVATACTSSTLHDVVMMKRHKQYVSKHHFPFQ
jgi:hypothetical protein